MAAIPSRSTMSHIFCGLIALVLFAWPGMTHADVPWILSGGGSIGWSYQDLDSGSSSSTGVTLGIGHGITDQFEAEILGTYLSQNITGSGSSHAQEVGFQVNYLV